MKNKKTKIDHLEEVFHLAHDLNLIEWIDIKKDYLTIKLCDTEKSTEILHKLTEHIRKNYPEVKHFHIRRSARELQIYHYRWLEHKKRLEKQEKTP